MTDHVHCQFCARAIKAKGGVIAHHGYQRPGWGYQTSSCPGARHVPYEQGHDVLDRYIEFMPEVIAKAEAREVSLMADPPETVVVRRDSYGRVRQEATRPADFDAVAAVNKPTHRFDYSLGFVNLIKAARNDANGARQTLEFLKERRAAWVAPESP